MAGRRCHITTMGPCRTWAASLSTPQAATGLPPPPRSPSLTKPEYNCSHTRSPGSLWPRNRALFTFVNSPPPVRARSPDE